MARFTIFGARGFIGSHLAGSLEAEGHEVRKLHRDAWPNRGEELGHVIYAIGLTGDFRSKPVETEQANVAVLADIFSKYAFSSLLYLSSTRVYAGAKEAYEEAALNVDLAGPGDIYNLTKLAGEALCLSLDRPTVRVARLSNVVGAGAAVENFLPSLIAEGRATGRVVMRTAAQSRKDYIDIDDVVRLLPLIALGGRHRRYNVASGKSVSNREIADLLQRELHWSVSFARDAAVVNFPEIDVRRLAAEFPFQPTAFEESLRKLLDKVRAGALP